MTIMVIEMVTTINTATTPPTMALSELAGGGEAVIDWPAGATDHDIVCL